MNKLKNVTKGAAALFAGTGITALFSDVASRAIAHAVTSHPKVAIIGIVASFIATLFHQPTK